jgi:ABC-type transporter Mla subunit MlaD
VESNGTAVDLDLVNNIMREPYADRFRLIINSLGASLAARGDDLAEIVDRSNPALRETNRVLAILAQQNHALAELARNGDTVLTPLARDRERIGSFINAAATTGEATAERGADLQRNFALLPQTLREVRSTMGDLGQFSDAARPVFSELLGAAPAITRLTKATPAFAEASTISLKSLGDAAAASGDNIRQAVRFARRLYGHTRAIEFGPLALKTVRQAMIEAGRWLPQPPRGSSTGRPARSTASTRSVTTCAPSC